MKLLPLETIAKEALCWALARALGLPVAQAYYVFVHPEYVEGFTEDTKRLPGNPENLAFGVEEVGMMSNRIENRRAVEKRIENWDQALACGVFDEWIFNRDRIPNNLLFAGKNSFVLIDHDDALSPFASVDTHSGSEVLRKLSEGKSEFERYALQREAEKILEDIRNVDWKQILQMVLHENVAEIEPTMFKKHIEFLRQRAEVLPGLVHLSLLTQQVGLMLDDEIGEEKEFYR